MISKNFVIAAAGAILSLTASAAYAIGPSGMIGKAPLRSQSIAVQKPTLAPYAFVKFCLENAADCAEAHRETTVKLTKGLMRELRQVNFEINRSIAPVNDATGDDEWRVDVTSGDCEDYALTKRRHLIELGWSPNALRMAIAYTPNNNGHAVLVVSTDRGDLVLDNRNNAVRNWKDTDLRWVMIQSSKSPLYWNEI